MLATVCLEGSLSFIGIFHFQASVPRESRRAEIRKTYRSKYPTGKFIIYPDQND